MTILRRRQRRCGESTRLPSELSSKAKILKPAATVIPVAADPRRTHEGDTEKQQWGDSQPRGDCADGV